MDSNSARAFKRILQADIDSGAVADHAALFARIAERGLEVRRNGEDYVSFKDSDGLKARVYFSFENPSATRKKSLSRERRKQRLREAAGCYIYALVAAHGAEVACYIGQTIRLNGRMREHLKTAGTDRSSGKLFEYSRLRGCEVKVAILHVVPKADVEKHDFSSAALAETEWCLRAEIAGMLLPGFEMWGVKDRRANADTSQWPLHEILLKAVPIELVAERDLDPADYAIDGFDHAL